MAEYRKICPICLKEFIAKRKNIICCCQLCASTRWKRNNKEKDYAISKKWHQEHNDRKAISNKKYSTKNKEKLRKYNADYYNKNKEKFKKYYRERYHIRKNDIEHKLKINISAYIRIKLKRNKNFTTFKFLDYNPRELKNNLESKFKDGMTWDNYGVFGWHIDHIRPTASFIFLKENGELDLEQIKECWSLDNLQPLWAKENISKGSKFTIKDKTFKFRKGKKYDTY